VILFLLLPSAWRPYAKTVVASLGLILSALAVALPDVPEWVPVGVSLLTALGVYAQPNGGTEHADETPTSAGPRHRA
jgi:hypothetical protein